MNQSLSSEFYLKKVLGNTKGFSLKSLLLILLLLVSVFGYLYLFTGLFGNHPNSNGEPVMNVVVKRPMPPRPKQTGEVKTGKAETVVKQDMKPTIAHPVASQPAPAHPTIENKSKPGQLLAKATTVKPPAAEPHPNQQAKPKPAVPAKSADKGKPVNEEGKSLDKPEKTVAVSASKTGKDKFTLLIGVYVLEKSMATEKAKLKAAGLSPVTGKGPKKMEPMTRLFMGEYDSRAQATEELQKLKKLTGDAFILPGKDKYTVYAGSYFTKGTSGIGVEPADKAGSHADHTKNRSTGFHDKIDSGKFFKQKRGRGEEH